MEFLAGVLLFHPVQYAVLGADDELLGLRALHEAEHPARRKRLIRRRHRFGGAFGVDERHGFGVEPARRRDPLRSDFVVDRAVSRPQFHFPPERIHDVAPQMAVGKEHDLFVLRDRRYDAVGVGAGAADVDFRLDGGGGVDVGDEHGVGVLFLVRAHGFRRRHVRHAAARFRRGIDHDRLRGEDLRRFGHERNAAEDDARRFRVARLEAQFQRIADEIGNVLHFGQSVVVSEYHRFSRGFESGYFIDDGGVHGV